MAVSSSFTGILVADAQLYPNHTATNVHLMLKHALGLFFYGLIVQ